MGRKNVPLRLGWILSHKQPTAVRHKGNRAFENGLFGLCNENFDKFVKENHSRIVRSPSNSSDAYVLSAEYIPRLIRITSTCFRCPRPHSTFLRIERLTGVI